MSTYYNEIEPYAAAWLRNLIEAGHLPAGDVDERSIVDVRGDDLRGYGACHFFAGIGGWPHALRLAGVPDDWAIWTGSCPCQPFSVAGSGAGTADERHLWPAFRWLIQECRPATVFGEQVAGKAGRLWLTGVRADMEALGYVVGAADLAAASVGAPHIRQRLYWVANNSSERVGELPIRQGRSQQAKTDAIGSSGGLANTGRERLQSRGNLRDVVGQEQQGSSQEQACAVQADVGIAYGVGDAGGQGLAQRGSDRRVQRDQVGAYEGEAAERTGAWSDAILIPCGDGKSRRIEPGIPPLATGVPARVGRLRAYGNAIVPPLAAEFVMAALAVRP